MIPWHRLFGLTLTDYFHDTAYNVEIEKDLSLKQQLLDVVILERKEGGAPLPEVLPDGLEDLSIHNLMTFKSPDKTLDHWAVEELAGHYVNYRKQESPSFEKLLPEEDFRLYAVCVRDPMKLFKRCEFRRVKKGVYDLKWGVRDVRTIVTGQVPKAKRNLPWLLFSASPEKVTFGMRNYQWKIPASRVVSNIAKKYIDEEVFMTYTMEDFNREVREELLQSLTKEERKKFLKGLDPEERLEGLDTEELLKALGPEERLKGLDPEELLKVLGPEKLLKVLDPKIIEEYLRKIKALGRS